MADKKLNSHVRFYVGLLIVCLLFSMPNLHAKPNQIAVKLLAFCLDTWNVVQASEERIEIDGKPIEIRTHWCGTLFRQAQDLAHIERALTKKENDMLLGISLFAEQTINPIIVKGRGGKSWEHSVCFPVPKRTSNQASLMTFSRTPGLCQRRPDKRIK